MMFGPTDMDMSAERRKDFEDAAQHHRLVKEIEDIDNQSSKVTILYTLLIPVLSILIGVWFLVT